MKKILFLFLIPVIVFSQTHTITSFSPSSGPVGATVIITGTNFSTTAAGNIVYFGAVKAAVTAATATQLTVTVPVGTTYQPITVTVNGYTRYSVKPFIVTFPSSQGLDVLSFGSKVDYTTGTGTNPYYVAIGDIDSDGKPDLVVVNVTSNTVSVLRNTSSSGTISAGSFASKVDFSTGTSPYYIAMGDIDGDGKLDLVVTNSGTSNTVSVFRNTSTPGSITAGSFAAKVDFVIGANPHSVAIGDIDGDGKPDLAVPNYDNNTVSVLRNISSPGSIVVGSFATKIDFATGTGPVDAVIGDIDGDGKPDLAVTNYGSTSISVLRNTSISGSITTGSFAATVDFATGAIPFQFALGDIDNDGKSDFVVGNYGGNSISVLKNTSTSGSITTGSFVSKVDFATGTAPEDVAISDVDGDGKPDIVVANTVSNTVSLFRNTSTTGLIGAGSFAAKVDLNTGTTPISVAIGDIDGDGKPDLAVANNTSNTVSVLRNIISSTSTLPTISSFTPSSGIVGSSVTMSGTNFSTTTTNNIVYFGAVKATVTAATATQLTVTVPTGATYQPITVTVNGLTAYLNKPFIVTFPSSQIIDASTFSAKVDFTAGTFPASVASGDIDGDGKADLVVVNLSNNSISVFRNTSTSGTIGSSSFTAKVDLAVGLDPRGMAVRDLDGDGKLDLVVANQGSNTISVFKNISTSGSISTSSFAAKIDLSTGTNPSYVAATDLDGDGKPDIAVVNGLSNTVSIFRNIGNSGSISAGSFDVKVDFSTGTNSAGVAIGDIDGDGKPDLAIANDLSNTVSVIRNTSISGSITTSSFAAKVDFSTGANPHPVALGDLDGDGKLDVVVGNYGGNSVSVYRNTSTPGSITTSSFAAKVDFTVGTGSRGVGIGDIDGDGKPEISVANAASNTVSVLKNISTSGSIGAGSFAAKVDFTTGLEPWDVAIGDFDGDGKSDFAVANASSNTVSVLRNTISSASTLPTISSFTPSSGIVGSSVTINGTNYGATQGTGVVRFGSTNATVTSWSNTQITATVPSITTGNYTISVITTAGTGMSSTQFTVMTTATFPDPIPPMYKTTVSTAITSSYINAMIERNGEIWMIGDNGLVAKATTMVAGVPVSWSLANGGIPFSEHIYAIDFPSSSIGFVGTGTGKIYRTTNGGTSWSLVYDRPDITNFINFIKFDNTGTGMTMGDGLSPTSPLAFLATSDGGTTWNNRNAGLVGATSINEVYFVTSNTGFMSGYATIGGKSYRGIFRTTNGGTNWSFSTVGNTTADSVTFTEALTFRTTQVGMAIRSDSTVWKTANGGITWTKVGQLPLMGFGVVFTSANSAFIAGRNGMVASVNSSNNMIYSVQLDPTLTLTAPAYSSTYSAVLLPVFNQVRAYFSSINAGTPLNTPSQQTPSNGAQISDTKATLTWSSVSGATVYDIEVGTSISSVMRGKMSTSSTTSTGISNLSASTLYQWRVRARSTTNSSAWSQLYSFTTATVQSVSNVVSASFPSAPKSSSDYRLITVPNTTSTTVEDYLKGSPPNDFRIFRDNGGSPPNHLTEMNASSSVSIGVGYWLLKKNDFIINAALNFPSPSTTTGAISITTRIGWNIIGTPYAVPVKWSDVRAANSLSANAVAYGYNGTSGFQPSDILEPFRGYYYFSNSGTLSIPFPFAVTPSPTAQEPALQLTLVHSSLNSSDANLKIGIDPAAHSGPDDFEMRKPPIFADQAAIWIDRPEWDSEHPRFAGDIRPALGDGQTWDIVLQHPADEPSRLTVENRVSIPEGFEVVIIDIRSGVMLKPDAHNSVAIPAGTGTSNYSVIVGRQSYIRSRTESFVPQQYVLHQNYPNPFNPATAIRFGITDDALVQVRVYDLLGREVATVVNGVLMSGNHEYSFNARHLASGMYIYTLRVNSNGDGRTLYTSSKKMMLVK